MKIQSSGLQIALIIVLAAFLIPAAAGETVFGDQMNIDSNSSITVFAQDVTVNNVEGDLTVFTQSLELKGPVSGDLTAYSQAANVWSSIGGDADFYTQDYSLRNTGQVNGTLTVAAQDAHINGRVTDANIEAENLVIDSAAQVTGNLSYKAETFQQQVNVSGNIVEIPRDQEFMNSSEMVSEAFTETAQFVVRILAGLLLIAVIPAYSKKVHESFTERTAASGFMGLMASILLPAATFILAVTIVGLPLAALTGILFVVLYLLGSFYGPYSIVREAVATEDRGHDYAAMVLGVVLWSLLDVLPVLGDVAKLVIAVVGIGAFVLPGWEGMGKRIRR